MKINQHILPYNLNYRSEIVLKLMASEVVAPRKIPSSGTVFMVKRVSKRKERKWRENREELRDSVQSNGSFTCAVIKLGSASRFVTLC